MSVIEEPDPPLASSSVTDCKQLLLVKSFLGGKGRVIPGVINLTEPNPIPFPNAVCLLFSSPNQKYAFF